jgi:hypothetical protein
MLAEPARVEVTVVDRRMFLSGAAFMGAGTAGATPAAAAPRATAATDDAAELREIATQISRYRDTMVSMLGADVEAVREQQRLFLKSTGKYPDYIEVGLGVWERLYDWHVRWQQPLTITRQPDGLYAMTFMLSTILLKPNMQTNYIGPGYDFR